jgi:hypothetical protein
MAASVPTMSPTGRRLPRISDAAKTAWIDLYRVFAALTGVWPTALAINVALSLVPTLLTGSGAFVSILIGATNAFFLISLRSIDSSFATRSRRATTSGRASRAFKSSSAGP